MIEAIEYKTGAEVLAGRAAVRARLLNPANRFVPKVEQPTAKIIELRQRAPLWQAFELHSNAHVIAYRLFLANLATMGTRNYIRMRCRELAVKYDEVMGTSRNVALVRARHRIMYEVWRVFGKGSGNLQGKSLPDIGRVFNRDHTTILHAVRKFEPGASYK